MNNLSDIQRLMAQSIMRPLTDDDRMQTEWTTGKSTEEIAASFIKPNDRLTSFERLEIYNRQYWFRLLDCLYEDYPGLHSVLGDKKFHNLARAYLDRYPSISFTLRNLGSRLVEFLQTEPRWTHPHEQLALDMARLEWAQVEAFDGENKPGTDWEKLVNAPLEKIKLRLQPYITLLDISYPVDTIVLRILKQENGLRTEASNAVGGSETPKKRRHTKKIAPTQAWLVVHRMNNSVYFKRVTEPEFHVLQAIAKSDHLAEAMAHVEHIGMNAEELQQSFTNWSSLGWFWIIEPLPHSPGAV
jgi:hypothetical protein